MEKLFTGVKPAKAFLKWAGGKGALLPEIDLRLPEKKPNAYYEPFVGAGSVLFHVLGKYPDLKKVVISDVNPVLINVYQKIKNEPIMFLHFLNELQTSYKKKFFNEKEPYYYFLRGVFNNLENGIYKAALFIFLNKTCFNGLYRVNKNGNFNVPFGKYEKPLICDKDNILAVSKALQKVEIICQNYHEINPESGALVYLDPPYVPVSKTSNFTGYTANGFGVTDQTWLKGFCYWMTKNNIKFLQSNSDNEFLRQMYSEFTIESIQARRNINSNGLKRGNVSELLIRNY